MSCGEAAGRYGMRGLTACLPVFLHSLMDGCRIKLGGLRWSPPQTVILQPSLRAEIPEDKLKVSSPHTVPARQFPQSRNNISLCE